jgi:enolase
MPLNVLSTELCQIYDSAGGATLEASINGHIASCPVGTSKSAHEAPIAPVAQALRAFEKAKKELLGSFTQASFDAKLSKLMPKLGAQATTALSLAFYNSEQSAKPIAGNTFPALLGNVLGGGAHATGSTKLSIQEILVMHRAKTLATAIEMNFKIWRAVGDALAKRGPCGLNCEAAWTADISNEAALELVCKLAKKARALVGVDIAASHFYKNGTYAWSDRTLSRDAHIARVLGFVKKYGLSYVEDPLHQEDFAGFSSIVQAVKGQALVCGDDLVATNIDRLKRAAREHAVDAVIIKPNQTGTVSGALAVIAHATKNKITPVLSHRSRETPDTSVCALAQLCPIAKLGVAGIRTVKLNGLLRLWRLAPKPKITKLRI